MFNSAELCSDVVFDEMEVMRFIPIGQCEQPASVKLSLNQTVFIILSAVVVVVMSTGNVHYLCILEWYDKFMLQ